jgi:UDPglucose 6-dehydrogenase
MKIAVIGTGYVGLVTGTCFAERGNTVICVDINKEKIALMQAGKVPIYEPGLKELFKHNIAAKRLSFTVDLAEGIEGAEVIFLALPTPPDEDGSADLSYILGAAADIAPLLKIYAVIVDKSTVPVGTAEKVAAVISKENPNAKFDVVSNPEFLKEGFAVDDFMNPDRVVIGTNTERAKNVMEHLYKPFITEENEFISVDVRSAEMTKYAANAFLATKISFMNEIANLCEKVGADVDAVRHGIGSDQRIGHKFLYPGIGYGGSCFPKDVQALQKTANEHDYEIEILRAVTTVNQKQKARIIQKILSYYNEDIRSKHFALWGLAFKPNTDDIREAPSLEIINDLITQGATVTAYDAEAIDNVKKYFGKKEGISYAENMYEALKNADALIVATEWNEFKDADIEKIKNSLMKKVIFDGRNIFELEEMQDFQHYEGIGRKVVNNV